MTRIMKCLRQIQHDQRGMASFTVTTVLVLVIALIIIGFAQVAIRNQQETVNRQLSTQAFYAAESGVNKTVASIREKIASGRVPSDKTSCADTAEYPAIKLKNDDVKVTCLLVSMQSKSLYYSAVTENAPVVVPLESANGQRISRVTLTWRSKTGGTTPTVGCPSSGFGLYTRTAWPCGHGILRTDLTDLPSGGQNDVAMSTFFYPRPRASVDETTAPQVNYLNGSSMTQGYCSDAGSDPKCMATITGLDATKYYMNLRSIYRDSAVAITGFDVNGNEVRFKGQAVIDVTAKAQDVLRRIQVRVPLESKAVSDLPAYAIESTSSICKRFSVEPRYYKEDSSITCN